MRKGNLNMHRSLKVRLLIYFFSVIGFISCGTLFSLIVISNVENSSKLLIDRYWQDNNLIPQIHSLLGEVLLLLELPPEHLETTAARRQLLGEIDKLSAAISNSTFQEDFRTQQSTRLRQLGRSLESTVETLKQIETRELIIDQIKAISTGLRERTELYSRNKVNPTREMIESSLSLVSATLLSSIGLGVLLAASVSVYFSERISVPLTEAADILLQIEKGDYETRATLSGIAEIDLIAKAINSLTVTLQQTRQ